MSGVGAGTSADIFDYNDAWYSLATLLGFVLKSNKGQHFGKTCCLPIHLYIYIYMYVFGGVR